MSEKELRNRCIQYDRDGDGRCLYCGAYDEELRLRRGEGHREGCPIAEPPDVAAVLRMIKAWRERHIDSETGYQFAPPDILLMTLEAAMNDIQDEFHVRLTADGYEWTEEATDEG